jgi:hypothetical protein
VGAHRHRLQLLVLLAADRRAHAGRDEGHRLLGRVLHRDEELLGGADGVIEIERELHRANLARREREALGALLELLGGGERVRGGDAARELEARAAEVEAKGGGDVGVVEDDERQRVVLEQGSLPPVERQLLALVPAVE